MNFSFQRERLKWHGKDVATYILNVSLWHTLFHLIWMCKWKWDNATRVVLEPEVKGWKSDGITYRLIESLIPTVGSQSLYGA